MNVYEMVINNVKRDIRENVDKETNLPRFDAFTAAMVIGAAFCKHPEEVLADLLRD